MTQADRNDPGEGGEAGGGRKTGKDVKSMRGDRRRRGHENVENGSWRYIYTDSKRETWIPVHRSTLWENSHHRNRRQS